MERETMEAEAPKNEKAVGDLLSFARQLINEGKPLHALQAVVVAMKSSGGEEAVFQALHRAREMYRSRLEEDATVDQLASLFAECAIAETQPVQIESPSNNIACPSIALDAHGTSILAETGRMQVVLDRDGFMCCAMGAYAPSKILIFLKKKSINVYFALIVRWLKFLDPSLVLDAVSDGSSFVCLKCGGLVSNHRKDEHYAYWCF